MARVVIMRVHAPWMNERMFPFPPETIKNAPGTDFNSPKEQWARWTKGRRRNWGCIYMYRQKRKTSKNKLRRTFKELSRNRFFHMYACWLRMGYSSWKSWAANIVFCSFTDTITNWWTKVDCLPPIPSSRESTRNKVDWECEQFSFCKAASTQNGIFNGKTSVDILISKVWSLWDDVLERRN